MKENLSMEDLKRRCQILESYLALALTDFETCCSEPYGFRKVCNLYRLELHIEHDLKDSLTDKELKTLSKLGLNTKTVTHPYKTGTWSWRYANDVKRLLGV